MGGAKTQKQERCISSEATLPPPGISQSFAVPQQIPKLSPSPRPPPSSKLLARSRQSPEFPNHPPCLCAFSYLLSTQQSDPLKIEIPS